MRRKTVRVWGLFYRVRVNSRARWDRDWVGPIGPYALRDYIPDKMMGWLGGRSFFFRTRQQARDVAKEKSSGANKTRTWVQYTVRSIKLTCEEIKKT